MSNLQEQVKDVCRLADAVVQNPSSPVPTTAINIGVCGAVAGFAASGTMPFAPIVVMNPLIAVAVWAVKKMKDKERESQVKERMLREVICKQQAVIKKLESELAKSRQQNAQNRQEIENLKEILRMLKETEEYLNAA